MKLVHALPPLAALVVAGFFYQQREREADAIRVQVVRLEQAVSAATEKQSPGRKTPIEQVAGKAGRESGEGGAVGKINLSELVTLAETMNTGGMPDMRAMMKLQTRLMEMDPAEVSALLAEAETTEMTPKARSAVQMMLLQNLVQKDPEAAVLASSAIAEGDGESPARWTLSQAFGEWAAANPQAALKWYDAQVAAGKFENKALSGVSVRRVEMESSLCRALIGEQPEVLRGRLEIMSAEERSAVLGRVWNLPTTPEAQEAFASMLTDFLPESERLDLGGRYAANLAREGSLTDVAAFLGRIEATPEVRRQTVENAALNRAQALAGSGTGFTAENSAEWRDWVAAAEPEQGSTIIGKVLGQALNREQLTIAEMTALLPEISAGGGRDEMVAGLLETASSKVDRTAALELADTISDETLRAAVRGKVEARTSASPVPHENTEVVPVEILTTP